MDLWKIDLKSFDDARYRKVCGAELGKVLDGIKLVRAAGFWVELVTLLVPGFNDSDAEVSAMARFIAGLSRDIPWHLTAFHPDHRMTDTPPTPPASLARARELAAGAGLRYVYSGNVPGAEGQHTVCPACGRRVVTREGFSVGTNLLGNTGVCSCGLKLPGVWA
jgi:pyruvate formate lyase activating enzyme